MLDKLYLNKELISLSKKTEEKIKPYINKIDDIVEFNSIKVLKAFIDNEICESDFSYTTGYGYNDIGRDKIEKVYSQIFKSEDALVRSQIISGTHAITIALFALLRPNDTLLSITGKPYDTLDEVIGIKENESSLKSYNINYEQIDLVDNDFNYKEIEKKLKSNSIKLIEIQRSKGYSTRKSISIEKTEKVIKFIKKISPNTIIMIDNCYCEFVTKKEPIEIGADIVVGSLIKNLGAGMVKNGGYICGKSNLIKLCAERLNVPGEAKEVGPSLDANRSLLMGVFMAPKIVGEALKTSIFTSQILEDLKHDVEPKANEDRVDIVQNIIFNNEYTMIKYCEGIQQASPIDSNVIPIPSPMPGYKDKVIMAAGTFTQGSSIELSCDGPLRSPYIAYQQGALTYYYGKIAVLNAISKINKM